MFSDTSSRSRHTYTAPPTPTTVTAAAASVIGAVRVDIAAASGPIVPLMYPAPPVKIAKPELCVTTETPVAVVAAAAPPVIAVAAPTVAKAAFE